jgi:hypothetical protein
MTMLVMFIAQPSRVLGYAVPEIHSPPVTSDLAAKSKSAEHGQGGGSPFHSAAGEAKCFAAKILPASSLK